jgi:hypothetical protein
VDSELSSNENASFLDDLDSVVDEVNAGLHISRSVTDVILKGILCDLQQKVTRQTASKDSEITLLKQLENGSLSLPEGWDKRYGEFYSIRQQLYSISKSLLNSEWGLSGSHHNSEGSEDLSKQRGKEQSSRDGKTKENGCKALDEDVFGDPLLLKHMESNALIAHFNKAMKKMKRQHNLVVHERHKIFKLKRQLLKNEGPNPCIYEIIKNSSKWGEKLRNSSQSWMCSSWRAKEWSLVLSQMHFLVNKTRAT